MTRLLLAPLDDFLGGLRATLPVSAPWTGLGFAVLGTIASWWVYVPLHELLHAFGCVASGGTVTRLELSPEYGAALLQKLFPFIVVGSDYAGRLSGFDTQGSDLTYLATVFGPYLITVLLGVPLLRRLARLARPGYGSALCLGVSLPPAFAPLVNLTGDYYEMGSIVVSRLAATWLSDPDPLLWRSDDLPLLARSLFFDNPFRPADLLGVSAGFVVGVVAALGTYALGGVSDRALARLGSRRGRTGR